MKQLARRVIGVMPSGLLRHILLRLATLNPQLRSKALTKFATVLAEIYGQSLTVNTNWGMNAEYDYQVDVMIEPFFTFGKPQFVLGEFNSMLLAAHLSANSSAFIDIGAYIGYYIFYTRDKLSPDVPIFYFEPMPDSFRLLRSNVERNHLPNVHGFQKAVGSTCGISNFYINDIHPTNHSLVDIYQQRGQSVTLIEVETVTFSEFVRENNLSNLCVKVDIEGAEDLFLDGALAVLDRISYLIIEVLDSKSDFLKRLVRLGFYVYHILENGLKYCPNGYDDYVHNQWNWLVCRHAPQDLVSVIKDTGLRLIT